MKIDESDGDKAREVKDNTWFPIFRHVELERPLKS